MYIGFGRLLAALAVVGLACGAVFGAGVVYGRTQRPAAPAKVAATSTPSGAVAAPGGGAGGAGQGGAGVQPVTGVIDAVTPTSIVVRQPSGTAVTVGVNAQTVVRKNEVGTTQDLSAGTQVIVVPDAAMIATSVQVVSAGEAGAGGRAGGARAGATGTPGGARQAGGAAGAAGGSGPAR
ncbi:MAG: hypothetical protein DWI59_02425 [Chloroflexi bacterium]|nr:MAG: hypothetical protein DWI59_02425 [Chloroflexota bacterium]